MNNLSTLEARYARAIEASRRVRWDTDRDVIRDRDFNYSKPFLPSGLSLVNELTFLSANDKKLLSQVQGRTYSYIFGLVERFIGAKVLDVSRNHWLGDQVALEALVRMTDEELKHQEMFRRLEQMMVRGMPEGYRQVAEPNAVAQAVLSKSTWAVLVLTFHIELFTQDHYRASIDPQEDICPLWKDVFHFHWREEAQHAILDEIEVLQEDAKLSPAQKDAAVNDFLALVGAVDGVLQSQAAADASYFCTIAEAHHSAEEMGAIGELILKAYRWQYLVSGAVGPRFQKVLFGLLNDQQTIRVQEALKPLLYAVPNQPEVAPAITA